MRVSGDVVVLYIQGKGHIEKDAPIRMPDQVETAIREYLRARKKNSIVKHHYLLRPRTII